MAAHRFAAGALLVLGLSFGSAARAQPPGASVALTSTPKTTVVAPKVRITNFKSSFVAVTRPAPVFDAYAGTQYNVSFKVKGPGAEAHVKAMTARLGGHDATISQSRLVPNTWKVSFAGVYKSHGEVETTDARNAAARAASIRNAALSAKP